MKIAVLSGKGGTGKTLVSVNLAAVAGESAYLDCDVEEPNGHLFFQPKEINKEEINVKIPQVDNQLCDGCRKCVEFCNFNALAYVKDRLIIFEDVCHSCGGCMLVCPQRALTEKDKPIGKVERGQSDQVSVNSGVLNTGEATGIPIIHKLLEQNRGCKAAITFIDCPPGSACIVMESIKDADYCILVAEPTLFGVHNLNMVFELVKLFKKPFGAILNKCQDEDNPAEVFCLEHNINILARIPFDRALGTMHSNGKIASRESEAYRQLFVELLNTVVKEVRA
ncbi:MAG TPA: 4Fe-4S binding protein [Clostridiaceae bacterium]|nr:4Fe-4S binding protein [Clostridiaceae bacterium]